MGTTVVRAIYIGSPRKGDEGTPRSRQPRMRSRVGPSILMDGGTREPSVTTGAPRRQRGRKARIMSSSRLPLQPTPPLAGASTALDLPRPQETPSPCTLPLPSSNEKKTQRNRRRPGKDPVFEEVLVEDIVEGEDDDSSECLVSAFKRLGAEETLLPAFNRLNHGHDGCQGDLRRWSSKGRRRHAEESANSDALSGRPKHTDGRRDKRAQRHYQSPTKTKRTKGSDNNMSRLEREVSELKRQVETKLLQGLQTPSRDLPWPESGETFLALKLRHVDRIYGDVSRRASSCGADFSNSVILELSQIYGDEVTVNGLHGDDRLNIGGGS
ncbi:unnamed protein product [Cuscuta campestris]|uniref:Uncharacterized protein n=1 Tax=Cuscuta campestris TaxID=132261 RepID=A0A484L2A1_9ASTE|nr:unnamed protein product [Cuscuta campestris]